LLPGDENNVVESGLAGNSKTDGMAVCLMSLNDNRELNLVFHSLEEVKMFCTGIFHVANEHNCLVRIILYASK
jgi:hypothetical protein